MLTTGIVTGGDGEIYISSEVPFRGYKRISSDGVLEWDIRASQNYENYYYPTPVYLSDGLVIFSDYKSVFCFDSEGVMKWEYEIQSDMIMVSKESKIFILESQGMCRELNSNGEVQRITYVGTYDGKSSSMPVFSPDSKTLYACGKTNSLVALDVES